MALLPCLWVFCRSLVQSSAFTLQWTVRLFSSVLLDPPAPDGSLRKICQSHLSPVGHLLCELLF